MNYTHSGTTLGSKLPVYDMYGGPVLVHGVRATSCWPAGPAYKPPSGHHPGTSWDTFSGNLVGIWPILVILTDFSAFLPISGQFGQKLHFRAWRTTDGQTSYFTVRERPGKKYRELPWCFGPGPSFYRSDLQTGSWLPSRIHAIMANNDCRGRPMPKR